MQWCAICDAVCSLERCVDRRAVHSTWREPYSRRGRRSQDHETWSDRGIRLDVHWNTLGASIRATYGHLSGSHGVGGSLDQMEVRTNPYDVRGSDVEARPVGTGRLRTRVRVGEVE